MTVSRRNQVHVCNDKWDDAVEGRLRLPLPPGCTVAGFAVGERKAVAVKPSTANSVRYLEKERGRAVATAAQVDGDVWETSVYPLIPHQVTCLRIQLVCALHDDCTVWLPMKFATAIPLATTGDVSDTKVQTYSEETFPDGILACSAAAGRLSLATESTALISGADKGTRHWCARIPDLAVAAAMDSAVVMDSDGRLGSNVEYVGLIIETTSARRLQSSNDLLRLRALIVELPEATIFRVWMYNRASVYVQGTAVEVVDALSKARYDGAPCEDHLLAALRDAKDDQKPCRFLVWLGKGHHVPVTDEVRAAPPVFGCEPAGPSVRWLAHQTGGGIGPCGNEAFARFVVSGHRSKPHISALGFLMENYDAEPVSIPEVPVDIWTDDGIKSCPDFRLRPCYCLPDAEGAFRVCGTW